MSTPSPISGHSVGDAPVSQFEKPPLDGDLLQELVARCQLGIDARGGIHGDGIGEFTGRMARDALQFAIVCWKKASLDYENFLDAAAYQWEVVTTYLADRGHVE